MSTAANCFKPYKENEMDEPFQGVCPVLNTPFKDNGDVDHEGLVNIVDYAIEKGCRSLSIFAMNSEPTKLTPREKIETLDIFINATKGRAHTAIGVIEDSLKGAQEMARLAEEKGADALILFPPGRVPPQGERFAKFLEAIAREVSIPVMYQDAPRTTGVSVSTEFLIDLKRRIPNLKYSKVECPVPVRRIDELQEATGGALRCMSGNGGIYTVDAFRRGAWAVMPGVAVVDRFVELYRSFAAGNLDGARDIFENMIPLLWFEDQSLEFFIACEKQILFDRGVIGSTHVRENGLRLNAFDLDELRALVGRLQGASAPAAAA
jgi:4-hydroxy-tetrahydrodipicolinate synthase